MPQQEADAVAERGEPGEPGDVPTGDAQADRPGRLRQWRDRARGHAVIGPVYRIAVLVVGVTIALAGVAMLALPGPGWAAIFIGLAVLASEFAMARRVKDSAFDRMRQARDRASDPQWRRRNRTLLIGSTAAVFLVVAALIWLWVDRYGWSIQPVVNLP
jgi:uncharacterized protein (TIGR02611 family)